MNKLSPHRSSAKPARTKKPSAATKSTAADHLGGQPENDEDARTAGFESATTDAPGILRHSRSNHSPMLYRRLR